MAPDDPVCPPREASTLGVSRTGTGVCWKPRRREPLASRGSHTSKTARDTQVEGTACPRKDTRRKDAMRTVGLRASGRKGFDSEYPAGLRL